MILTCPTYLGNERGKLFSITKFHARDATCHQFWNNNGSSGLAKIFPDPKIQREVCIEKQLILTYCSLLKNDINCYFMIERLQFSYNLVSVLKCSIVGSDGGGGWGPLRICYFELRKDNVYFCKQRVLKIEDYLPIKKTKILHYNKILFFQFSW